MVLRDSNVENERIPTVENGDSLITYQLETYTGICFPIVLDHRLTLSGLAIKFWIRTDEDIDEKHPQGRHDNAQISDSHLKFSTWSQLRMMFTQWLLPCQTPMHIKQWVFPTLKQVSVNCGWVFSK